MSLKRALLPSVIALFFAIPSVPAFADIVVNTQTSGTTSGGSVSATASFDINLQTKTLVIKIVNTTAVNAIAQAVSALNFGVTGLTGLTLSSVSVPLAFEDCSNGTCQNVSTFYDYHSNTTLTSPYGWVYGSFMGGTGVAAGNGSLKPGSIVNSQPSMGGGIPNTEHNDYLRSDAADPVSFNFSFTSWSGSPNITSATFYWGTAAESTQTPLNTPPVPEPSSIFLLAFGVFLLGARQGLKVVQRRRLAASH